MMKVVINNLSYFPSRINCNFYKVNCFGFVSMSDINLKLTSFFQPVLLHRCILSISCSASSSNGIIRKAVDGENNIVGSPMKSSGSKRKREDDKNDDKENKISKEGPDSSVR